jgi:hypothetical protein
MKLARHDAQVRRFMTVPGVGPITAFNATIDDPAHFVRSRSVGAYVGLTSRRHASGEVDWTGRISKCGDAMKGPGRHTLTSNNEDRLSRLGKSLLVERRRSSGALNVGDEIVRQSHPGRYRGTSRIIDLERVRTVF